MGMIPVYVYDDYPWLPYGETQFELAGPFYCLYTDV